MLYLVFGSLLLLGSIVIICFFYFTQGGKKTKVKVIDSTCNVKRNEDEITDIVINHLLQITTKDGEKECTTSCLPVREAAGSEIIVHMNKKTGEPEMVYWSNYIPAIAGMVITGFVCLIFFFIQTFYKETGFHIDYRDILLILFFGVGMFSLHEMFLVFNPNVVKVKGSFEGWMCMREQRTNCEIYSLWYGEHQQYAKCTRSSVFTKIKQKENVLYYHVKKGTVRKKTDIIGNVCFGFGLIAVGLAVYFLPFV